MRVKVGTVCVAVFVPVSKRGLVGVVAWERISDEFGGLAGKAIEATVDIVFLFARESEDFGEVGDSCGIEDSAWVARVCYLLELAEEKVEASGLCYR